MCPQAGLGYVITTTLPVVAHKNTMVKGKEGNVS